MSTATVRTFRFTKSIPADLSAQATSEPVFSYTLEKEIGRGRFAKVCEARHKISGDVFAAKISRRWRNGGDKKEEILREKEILQQAEDMKHIVKVRDHFVDLRNVILLLERANGGDLFQLISSSDRLPPESYTKSAIRQLLEAVTFLRDKQIVHLDIKPENILLRHPYPDCDIVLCDFGLAKYLRSSEPVRDLVGTPDFVAPEVLNYDPIHFNTDLWSVGVVAYYLLTGVSPFWAPTKDETLSNVCQVRLDYPDDLFEDYSPYAIPFIQQMIQKRPCDRPSAAVSLTHAWLEATEDEASTETDSERSPTPAAGEATLTLSPRPDLDRSCGE